MANWVPVDEIWEDAKKVFPDLTKEEFLQQLHDLEKKGFIKSSKKKEDLK